MEQKTDDFVVFIKKNKTAIIISFLFVILSYIYMLTHFSLTIDEETWFNGETDIKSWITQGRYGIYWINKLFSPNGQYFPIIGDWIAVILWTLSSVFLLYSIVTNSPYYKYSKFSVVVFISYFSVLPLVSGELLSYSMFNIHMSASLLLVSLACVSSNYYIKSKKPIFLLFSIILLFLSMSIYQAFINVYIVWAVIVIFGEVIEQQKNIKNIIITLTKFAVIAIFATSIYLVGNKLMTTFFVPDGGYLSENYWGWRKYSNPLISLFMALANVVRLSFGITIFNRKIYGGFLLCITTAVFLITVFLLLLENIKNKFFFLLVTIVLLIAPFSLYILLGTHNTPGRVLVGLAFIGAFEWFFVINYFKNKGIKYVINIISIIVIVINGVLLNKLFFDSQKVYLADKNLVNELILKINAKGYDYKNTPVFFIGMSNEHIPNNLAISGSTGGSFFNWDDGNNMRMVKFFQTENYNIFSPTPEQRVTIVNTINSQKELEINEVLYIDNCIVVYLSLPSEKWYTINM